MNFFVSRAFGCCGSRAAQRRSHGFTLIEVLLAIVIVTGLLVVALYFYQQAAQLRTDLQEQTERISAARLLMDRLTTELRCARRHSYFEVPLVGQRSSIQFITTSLPSRAAWAGEAYGRISRPETDLKFVSYKIAAGAEGTNAVGLTRSEEPLVVKREVPTATATLPEGRTNGAAGMLMTEQLKALQFRYWNGSAWEDSWNDTRLPQAVEITLSAEPLPDPAEPAGEPAPTEDVFRRVVYLPGSAAPAPMGNGKSTNLVESSEVLF